MKILRPLVVLLLCTLTAACKLVIVVPEGGSVTAESGAYSCAAGTECSIDIVDTFFSEAFAATPSEGYEFTGWKKRAGGFCGNSLESCALTTENFGQFELLMAVLESDQEFYLEPEFAQPDEETSERLGFEILQVISQSEIRAYTSAELTLADFEALEVPSGWIKNQPRAGDGDTGRFLRSPDGTADGEYHTEEFFGFNWLHVATVIETDVVLDDEGLLRGIRVVKYHETTFEAGSTLVLLVSPAGEAYFRIGRDATRTIDDPTIPEGWQLVEYTTEETLVIELFGGNLVIRTDNEDSFQGPVAGLPENL